MKRLVLSLGLAVAGLCTAMAQDNVISHVLEYASDGTLNSRIEYTYDTLGLVMEKRVLHPGASGDMDNYARTVYGYDDERRQSVVENYLWDDNTLSYYGKLSDDDAKTVTTFNGDNLPEQVLYYQWGSAGWGGDDQWKYRGTFEYSGNCATETRTEQINGIPKGTPSMIVKYAYDSQWRIVEKTKNVCAFDFETYENVEMPTDRWIYEYDDHDNVTLEQHYTYIDSGDDWGDPWEEPWATQTRASGDDDSWALLYSYKYEYTYDGNGNMATKKQYSWDEIEAKYLLTYDFAYEYHYASNDALPLDYANSFDSGDALAGFAVDDGNGDGESWTLGDGTVECTSTVASQAPEILYLPALRLTTDFEVEISLDARVADPSSPAKLQLILCQNDNSRTPLGTIGQVWDIGGSEPTTVLGRVVASESRPYVIGICFDNAQVGSTLIIDHLEVKNGRSTSTPQPASYFTATPARDGSLQVQLTWTPSPYTIGGQYIHSLTDMVLCRDGVEQPIHSTGAIGTTLGQQCVDHVPAAGTYTYRLYSIAGQLVSDAAMVTVRVGQPVPTIANLQAIENADHSVTLSWDAADAVDGEVKYYIVRNGDTVLASEHRGTSFVDAAVAPETGQAYCYYTVYPYNEIGYGDGATTTLLFVGEPTPAPFTESFAGGAASHQWVSEKVSGHSTAWGIGSGLLQGMSAQDGDGGLAAFLSTSVAEGDVSRLTSEKIDISALTQPQLSFYMYHTDGDATGDALVIEASSDNGPYQTVAGPFAVSGHAEAGWALHSVDLDRFAGERHLRLSFRGISGAAHDIFVDNIAVDNAGSNGVSDALANATSIRAADGAIVVTAPGNARIQVCTATGAVVYNATAAQARIPVASGIYVVVVDGTATKVAVR